MKVRLSLIVMAGNRNLIEHDGLSDALEKINNGNGNEHQEFVSGKFWMLPLHQRKRDTMDLDEVPPLLGLLGVAQRDDHSSMEKDQRDALWLLADRAAMALEDRLLQHRVFRSLQDLQPRVDMLQRLRAFGRYDSRVNLLDQISASRSRLGELGQRCADPLLGRSKVDEQSTHAIAGCSGIGA